MQTEPSMRYESKEQMLQLAEDTIERAYKPLEEWFTVFPKAPCKVLPVPTQSEKHAPPAYYFPPLPFVILSLYQHKHDSFPLNVQ